MKYCEFRKLQNKKLFYTPLIDYYAYLFSPIFTKYFIKHKIVPNTVTVLMIISGIMGAILFAIPNLYIKILGVIFIHTWYILDASDGEVARITHTFSKYGKEFDYTAHAINHPLFIISFCFNVYQIHEILSFVLLIIFALDTMMRNLFAFYAIQDLKENNAVKKIEEKKAGVVKYLILTIDNFPLFTLCFPIVWGFGMLWRTEIMFVFVALKLLVSLFVVTHLMIMWTKHIYRS